MILATNRGYFPILSCNSDINSCTVSDRNSPFVICYCLVFLTRITHAGSKGGWHWWGGRQSRWLEEAGLTQSPGQRAGGARREHGWQQRGNSAQSCSLKLPLALGRPRSEQAALSFSSGQNSERAIKFNLKPFL